MIGRRVRALTFDYVLEVRRVPDGEVAAAAASRAFRRRGREMVMVRLASEGGEQFALALNSENPVWRWPTPGEGPVVVMLYRADGDRRVWPELRRLTDVQRRDALFKAELVAPGGS